MKDVLGLWNTVRGPFIERIFNGSNAAVNKLISYIEYAICYVMLREVRMLFNISKIVRMNIKYKPHTLLSISP